MKREFRKPLVVLTPKSLLRHKKVVSTAQELSRGHFQEVLTDIEVDPARVKRVLLCSGKIYYDLDEGRRSSKRNDTAIIRIEQFYPFLGGRLSETLAGFRNVQEWIWVQEESQNMGAWCFLEPRLRELSLPVKCVARDPSASPATGSLHVHRREQEELVSAALNGPVPYLVRAGGRKGVPQTPVHAPEAETARVS